jgi:hypothetical protein
LRISISFFESGTMLILYQAVLCFRTRALQQRPQSQQILAIRYSCLRQSETVAESTIEHPAGHLQRRTGGFLLQSAKVGRLAAPLDGAEDQHRFPVPGMP